MPADRFHAALHKLLIVRQTWSFRETLEFVYYLRNFEFRIDGGGADDAIVDLSMLDRLVTEVLFSIYLD